MIAAIDRDGAIGRAGDMPWHIREDMLYFKRTTMGHTVVMGRRTWESLGCRPLPGRRNVVVSSSLQPSEGMEVVKSIEQIAALSDAAPQEELFIIGGGSLYRSMMDLSERLYITHVDTLAEGADTWFPEIDSGKWVLQTISERVTDEKSGLSVRFAVYVRA